MLKRLIYLIILLILVSGCKRPSWPCPWVYKTKDDYSGMLPAFIDKNTIALMPGHLNPETNKKLNAGYILGHELCHLKPKNLVFFDISLSDWRNNSSATRDLVDVKLKNGEIIKDPFSELYICEPDTSSDEVAELIEQNSLSQKCKQIIS